MTRCYDACGCKNERACFKELAGKFRNVHRHKHFGECVNSLKIEGYRGLNCTINFEYPVTAITGLNGTGKTTVGQLLLCGYRKFAGFSDKRHYIFEFFPQSILDKNPFENNARAVYNYQQENEKRDKSVTVYRKEAEKRWGGYRQQPERESIIIGPAIYLPKYERSDVTIYEARYLEIVRRIEISNGRMWATRILHENYEDVFSQHVRGRKIGIEVSMAKQNGIDYSENNMGLGEGRIIRIIKILEACPEKSLVVLDEPDIGLHSAAQREFAKYLVCLSYRRGHQIIFSTHSTEMVEELPQEGRIMLEKKNGEVIPRYKVSSVHIRNALSLGQDGFFIIFVEDRFAKKFLEEIILRYKADMLNRVKIRIVNGAEAVSVNVNILMEQDIPVTGILDGDRRDCEESKRRENEMKSNKDEKELVLPTFPGPPLPPERVVFEDETVKDMILREFEFNFNMYLNSYDIMDHHEYSYRIHQKTQVSIEKIEFECIKEFVKSQSENWADELIGHLKDVFES